MRNKILSVMIAAGMMAYGASAFGVPAAPAIATSTVTIHGHVNDSPCEITGGGNVDINYNEVSNKHITATPSHEHPFTIHLENCTFASSETAPKVSVLFATANMLDSASTAMDAGSGVGVQITDNNSTTHNPINLKSGSAIEVNFPDKGSKTLDLNFSTWLVQFASDTVTPGNFSATATYTLTYS